MCRSYVRRRARRARHDGVGAPATHGVELVRWPSQAARRDRFARDGIPRLLLVEPDDDPPPAIDLDEDWVRLPVDDRDIEARAGPPGPVVGALDDARPWIDGQACSIEARRRAAGAGRGAVARTLLASPGRSSIVARSNAASGPPGPPSHQGGRRRRLPAAPAGRCPPPPRAHGALPRGFVIDL